MNNMKAKLYEPFFNTPLLAIALLDKEFNYIEVNETFAKSCNSSPSFFPGKNHFALNPSEALSLFREAVENRRQVQSVGRLSECEGTMEQDFTYWEWTLSPVLDEQGEVDVLVFSLRNVTSKVRAEHNLIKANENNEHILESISGSFYFLDHDFIFTYANRAAEQHTKSIITDSIIGRCIWDLFPAIKETIAYEKFHSAMEQRTCEHFEFPSPYTNKWTDVYVYPSPQGVSVFFNDITHKRESELEFTRSQEKFATIFHASPTIMSIRCLKTDRYVEVNDAWIEAIGYTRDEVIGKTPLEMGLPTLPGAPTMTDVFKTRQLPFKGRPRPFHTKSRGIREGIMSATLIDINGDECALVTTTDMTEQRALEREMQRLDKLNVIAQMASGVGHEIRNPLTVVRGFLQLLQGRYPDSAYQFNLMISELDRANGIITEFLALAKTKPDEQKLANINEVIERIFPMLRAKALEFQRDICLEVSSIPEVLLSEPEVRQILLNLTINAIEASDHATQIDIRTYRNDKDAIISVTNKGPIISPEVKKRLGTPFFTTKDHGTGLGLAISYNLAKLHGGSIDVESNITETTFYLRLPLTQEA